MKKGAKLGIIIAALIIFIGGAYLLYNKLGDKFGADQLSTESGSDTNTNKEETETGESESSGEEEKTLAPDFTVYDGDGNEVKLSQYIGKPIVLNFWASWCGPCKMEMPEFQEKYNELQGEVEFLMINMTMSGQETLEKATKYVEEEDFTFPVFYDTTGDVMTDYGIYSYPTTFFLDKDGYFVAHATGAIDGDTLMQGIDMIR